MTPTKPVTGLFIAVGALEGDEDASQDADGLTDQLFELDGEGLKGLG